MLGFISISPTYRAVQSLTAASAKLLAQPRLGERLDEFAPRDVRRIFIEHYEMRYEIQQSIIYVLRLWHTRENRYRSATFGCLRSTDRLGTES